MIIIIMIVIINTSSKVKRELLESIVHCYLRQEEEEGEERLKWACLLVDSPHEKDTSSWQLLAECYKRKGNDVSK